MCINSYLLLMLSLMVNKPHATMINNEYPHFYIYDISEPLSKRVYNYGHFKTEKEKIVKTGETQDSALWMKEIFKNIESLPKNKKNIILYIHGFQGDNKHFVEESGYVIQEKIFSAPEHEYGLAISMQWKTSMKYEESVLNAVEKGKYFASYMHTIFHKAKQCHPDTKISIICHSMGSRVFQGLYEEWVTLKSDLIINKTLLFAADLEAEVFDKHFPDIANHTEKLYVFHSLDDRTLQMANIFSAHKRLGSVGPIMENMPSNFTIRDATAIRDDETFAGKMSLHRYYYGSPTIRKEIVEILSLD